MQPEKVIKRIKDKSMTITKYVNVRPNQHVVHMTAIFTQQPCHLKSLEHRK